ncbi:hypothetical protein [Lactococcus phage P1048]|uniref:Uncharacterized protein n=1 Tax=Lactococcus phage P1048 TaxID=2662295 RepID=A0A649V234_9CAUD|nr:hypothetical protein H1Z36_gp068 [Lactococcus phage P1048]QGJ84949.1 hypothetical protein [Lactococcus phage P1048]
MMTQFEKDLDKLLYLASVNSKDYVVVYSEFVRKYELILNQTINMKEFINDVIHECDYGCDNNCELDGTLSRYAVEDLKGTLDSIEGEYNESL